MTEADIQREAHRVVSSAHSTGVDVRLVGGLAIARHCPSAEAHPELTRTYADIDLVARPKTRGAVTDFFEGLGYQADERFNSLHGHSRLLFYDTEHERQVDVFLGVFRMCHTLDFSDRFFEGYDTLPLADLALTKLQIVQINEKDAKDAVALFLDHDLADTEAMDAIDVGRLKEVCSGDWGFYTTVTDNLERVTSLAEKYLSEDEQTVLAERLHRVAEELERASKSVKWRLRSKVGRKAPWYDLPEEVRDPRA